MLPRCRGGGGGVVGVLLLGGGGGCKSLRMSFNKHVWPESEIVGGEFDPGPVVEIDHELIF